MKRTLSCITAFLLIMVLFSGAVFATSATYNLDELGIRVTIPSDYWVVTRDTPADATVFNVLDITKDEWLEWCNSEDSYLWAYNSTYGEQINIVVREWNGRSFDIQSETELEIIAEDVADSLAVNGAAVSHYELYQNPQVKFIKMYLSKAKEAIYYLQYYSFYDGNVMIISMSSDSGEISSRQEETIQSIVDSVRYDNPPAATVLDEEPDLMLPGSDGYLLTMALALILTVIAYCAFPLIFALARKKPIQKKKYRRICFGVNVAVMIMFAVINGKFSSFSPYILWTSVFSYCGVRILDKKELLDDGLNIPEDPEPAPWQSKPVAEAEPIRFCGKCGEKLLENCMFCHKCGTQVVRQNDNEQSDFA